MQVEQVARLVCGTVCQLNDDVLSDIFSTPDIRLADAKAISLASRRLRTLIMPRIFGRHTWSPWRYSRRSFPPQSLWAHIRVLVVVGPFDEDLLDLKSRELIVAHFHLAARRMTAAHTIIIRDITGGMWPQLLNAIATAPALAQLTLEHSPCLGEAQNIFDLSSPSALPPIRRLEYTSPHALKYSGRIAEKTRRPMSRLESEVKSLGSLLQACHSSLESLRLPGELLSVFCAMDSALTWNSLGELRIEGYWPERPDPSLLSTLLSLRNLRIALIHLCPVVPGHSQQIVPTDLLDSVVGAFLPRLKKLEVTSLIAGDRVLSVLPPGLETLAIIEYPEPRWRIPLNILLA
ncbi:hypothetical protein FB451DRAFT_1549446 [Mycena latifolia]|nr:hypothetical protein FB451DRAFT_1549446 [Mycena latifolia]